MDDTVIKIHLSIFLNRYNNNINIPDNIVNKAEHLRKTCNCFNSSLVISLLFLKF